MRRTIMVIVVLMLGLALIAGSCAPTAPVGVAEADFFKGERIRIITSDSPGGGTDRVARVFAPYLAKELDCIVTVENMGGGGKIATWNYIWDAVPDGLRIGCDSITGFIVENIYETPGVKFDAEKFSYFGSVGDEASVLCVAANSPINSAADLMATPNIKISASVLTSRQLCFFSYLLDLDAKVITGFKSATDCKLSVMQGETIATLQSSFTYIRSEREGTLKGIVVLDSKRSSAMPHIPAITEVKPLSQENLDLLKLLNSVEKNSKVFYGPPGITEARVAFLRETFNRITSRDDYRADMDKWFYPGMVFYTGEEDVEIVKFGMGGQRRVQGRVCEDSGKI